jgi:site-specific DNA-methyltransferase (cytosine-N4-specific)
MNNWINKVHTGDCREVMRQMIADGVKVQMCVTSPPYWGLRDYGTAKWEGGSPECDHNSLLESQLKPGSTSQTPISQAAGTRARQNRERLVCRKCGAKRIDSQLGLEKAPEEFVQNLVEVFRLVRELLADDGTCWINLGDSYAGGGRGFGYGGKQDTNKGCDGMPKSIIPKGVKPKDLIGIPWRVAFALQADGWWLRQDIIWAKPNPMPESVTDRCTKSHEYIFLLTKSAKYFYDADAIAEPFADERMGNPGKYEWRYGDGAHGNRQGIGKEEWNKDGSKTGRNKRSVWTVATKPYSEAHFATFPPALIEPCILAGSRKGDTVLDPFFGSGTTGEVAEKFGRDWIGIDLNPAYYELSKRRTAQRILLS